MTEFSTDIVRRMIEDLAGLAARLATMQALGMQDDAIREIELIEQASGRIQGPESETLLQRIKDLRSRLS